MFSSSSNTSTHYNRLYSCKHFRNRIIKLQQACAKNNADAILLALGMDVCYDEEMTKLQNWLLFGLSSTDISGHPMSDIYQDSFLVISRDSLQVYTNSAGFKELSNLTTLISNCNIYTITKSDENDQDKQEVIKVSKFYEMIYDKKTVGIPVREVNLSDHLTSEVQIIEKWPLIQAYGLDVVGGGFFTMKHAFISIRNQLNAIYHDYDAFAIYRIVFDEIDKFNTHYYDNFFSINKDTPQKRLERTEQDLVDQLWLRQEFSLINNKQKENLLKDNMPQTRVLFGPNSNKQFDEMSDKEQRLYKYNLVDKKDAVQHFTLEFNEKNTNLRFARTYFLNNLTKHYMQGFYFSEEEDLRVPSKQGKLNELNSKILLNAYFSLIETFNTITEDIFKKAEQFKLEDMQGLAYAMFGKLFAQRSEVNIGELNPAGKESFQLDVKRYNTFGQEIQSDSMIQINGQQLIVVRMQIYNILSPYDKSNLGSVQYANSYFWIDKDTTLNLTMNVPNFQAWYTTNKHYENLSQQIQTEKNLQCERLGDRVNYYTDLIGYMPIKEPYSFFFNDFVLSGKLIFYQKGFIFVDNRINCLIQTFEELESITFYVTDDIWVEFKTKGKNSLPMNLLNEDVYFLKFTQQQMSDKFKVFQQLVEKEFPECKLKRIYQKCPLIENSIPLKNYDLNAMKYNKTYSSDYLNFQFVEEDYTELLEFQTIKEFNLIRGKEFLPYNQFHQIYSEFKQKGQYANTTTQLIGKLNKLSQNKSNVIIVSGIPGSGKTKLAEYLTRQLVNEQVNVKSFKVGKIENSVKFNISKFIQEMVQFKSENQNVKVVVATLPSYNHLKKIIFELKKSQEFSEQFDIKYIITKVYARNYYMNKNRNTFQFLIENCMKGVTQAIVFEKSNVSQQELAIMQKCLENANFEQNILHASGRTFKLEDLAKILVNNHHGMNSIYNKFCYGFEKEGKSNYYLEKQVQGAYFPFRYPLKEELIASTIMMALNIPLRDISFLYPKVEFQSNEESKEDENKENYAAEMRIVKQRQKEELESMTREEKRKMDREIKEKKKIEADLESEKMLIAELEQTKKRLTGSTDLILERIRGHILLEGKEEEQDYELICNFNELTIRPLKNQNKRLRPEELGILVYGRNLSEMLVKEVLKTSRTFQKRVKSLRNRENITKDEIEMLKIKYLGEFLPDDWFYNGSYYLNYNGETSVVHPNLDGVIKYYIEEQNASIGAINREIQKEIKQDQKKYEN